MSREFRRVRLAGVCLVSSFVTTLGCAPDASEVNQELEVTSTGQAIIHGHRDSGHSYVGHLTGDHGCTAELIGPRTAITAGHCVARGEQSFPNGGGPIVYFLSDSGQVLDTGYVKQTVPHPYFTGEDDWDYDLALLFFTEAIAVPPVPLAHARADEARDITLVGFGCTQTGGGVDGYRYSGTNRFEQVGLRILTTKESRAQSCKGDSGGALVQTIDGVEHLYGVITGENHAIGYVSSAEAIYWHLDWIQAQMLRNFDAGARSAPVCGLMRGQEGLSFGQQHLASCNNFHALEVQADGDVAVYRENTAVWEGRHDSQPGYSVNMQSDGNLVLYDRAGNATWRSDTVGHPGAQLRMQNDGNLVVYAADQTALWASNTTLPTPNRCRLMKIHEGLGVENTLSSCNGFRTLRMQRDGNLVLYDFAARAAWATGTWGKPGYFATLQPDGNFVLYDRSDAALWSTGTFGTNADHVALQNDGNLVVYTASDEALWWSGTVLPGPSETRFLRRDQALTTGQNLTSRNGFVDLRLQNDGNLVLYSGSRALWASNTYGRSSYLATVQPDGNFVLYDRNDVPSWASGTLYSGETYLAVQNDGNLVVYSSGDIPQWASHTRLPAPNRCHSMFANELLFGGERIWSCNGSYYLEMQTDGNLVLYKASNGRALWSSGTFGSTGYAAIMQPDGNLVVYDMFDQPLASTGTFGRPGAYLAVQDDGNLVVYTQDAVALWASNTAVVDRLEPR